MVFLESFKGGAKSFQFDSKGCVESIKRGFQETFRGVTGVFLRVFEASSKGVLRQYQGSFQRVSSKFLDVSWKISRMFQECFKTVLWK